MENRVLQNIEPREVFRYFEDLTRIPRESGNERQVTDYLTAFAEEHGLEWFRDEALNVIIRKKASPGYEDHTGVILQGHSDMVCEKNEDTVHDFEKDPIKLVVDGDHVTAAETTLGADDGIGVAIALALLADDNAKHPSLEFVCTSDEERGMKGVEALDTSLLSGRIFINLDANDEDLFTVGCAGGPAVRTEIPVTREEAKPGWVAVHIKIHGLVGGHSGEDIHRGRANSIKLMVRTLLAVEREIDLRLVDLRGGLKYNAIPREANAAIIVPDGTVERVNAIVSEMEGVFRNEYRMADPEINAAIDSHVDEAANQAGDQKPMSKLSTQAVLNYISFAETGIIRMDMEFEDTVESSVSLGVVSVEEDKAVLQALTRSSLRSMYMEMYYKIQRLAESVGGKTELMSNCPEWEYDPDSHIKTIFKETYKKMYGKEPGFVITHAGLECGVIKNKSVEPIDMIATGPVARNLHTPGEYVSISSTARFWNFIREALSNI